jgi:hypothetical protein
LENAARIKIKTKNMAKYSQKAQDKIEKVMHEFKEEL